MFGNLGKVRNATIKLFLSIGSQMKELSQKEYTYPNLLSPQFSILILFHRNKILGQNLSCENTAKKNCFLNRSS